MRTSIYVFVSNPTQPIAGLTDAAIRPLMGQEERPCPRPPLRMSPTPPAAGAGKKPCAVPANIDTNTTSHRNIFLLVGDGDVDAAAQAAGPLEGVISSCAGTREMQPRVKGAAFMLGRAIVPCGALSVGV